MAINDLTGLNISSTYKRLLTVGDDGLMYDGTGSLYTPLSASHEVTKELSSSYAETASFATNFTASGNISASGNITATGDITSSNNLFIDGDSNIHGDTTVGALYQRYSPNGSLDIEEGNITMGGRLHLSSSKGHITASGNISASGLLYASQSIFGTGAGSSKDFDFYGNAQFHSETFLQNFDALSGNSRFRDNLTLYFGDDRQYGIKYSSITDKFNIVSGSSNDLITIDKQGNISSSGEVMGLSGSFTSLTISKIDGGTF